MNRFPFAAVHEVNLPCFDGVGPGIDIVDGKSFHLVEIGSTRFPVVRISSGDGGDTRRMTNWAVTTASGAGGSMLREDHPPSGSRNRERAKGRKQERRTRYLLLISRFRPFALSRRNEPEEQAIQESGDDQTRIQNALGIAALTFSGEWTIMQT